MNERVLIYKYSYPAINPENGKLVWVAVYEAVKP